jgi:RNA polymerase sigma-70 factor, ECF subfamily
LNPGGAARRTNFVYASALFLFPGLPMEKSASMSVAKVIKRPSPILASDMSFQPEVIRESDEDLLKKVASGDEAAFGLLYDRFSAPLLGLVRKIVDDAQEAEDVLQEGFIHLWERAKNFDVTRSKAFTWSVMIFRSKAIDRVRARSRRARLAEQAAGELPLLTGAGETRADVATDQNDRGSLVRRALLALPQEQRRLIEFAFIKGLTHQGIAESLGVPLGTVKTSIRRGLLRLRDTLKGGVA